MDENKVIEKLVEHDERLDVMEQRFSILLTRDEFLTVMDGIAGHIKTLSQEYVFITHRLDRIDGRLDNLEVNTEQVNQRLGKIENHLYI